MMITFSCTAAGIWVGEYSVEVATESCGIASDDNAGELVFRDSAGVDSADSVF
jgi:hypothetical protein